MCTCGSTFHRNGHPLQRTVDTWTVPQYATADLQCD